MKIAHDSATPAHGQQIISVTAFIHKNEGGVHKVFLPRRAETKAFLPGLWEMPGGHVDFGEDIVAGLKREVLEEFNMKISVGDPFACFTYINKIKGSHSIEVVYFATFTTVESNIQINPEDHSEYRWFNKKEISEIVQPSRHKSKIDDSVGETINDDPEIIAILKGFELLDGSKLDTGLAKL